jgi:RNA polymerase sigma-70 factor (ECF subfamily)
MNTRDEQLATEVQRGDIEAFGELVARYEAKLLRYGRRFLSNREDIADLVQNTFLKAFENIKSYDAERPFSPWIYRIAHNEFVGSLGSVRHALELLVDWDVYLNHPTAPEKADRDALDRELRAGMETCLGKLDAKYREPLILFYDQELSYKSIAEILHIPVATVGVRISRARVALRAMCQTNLSTS